MFDTNKISDYLISYYKMTPETPYEIKEIPATQLLNHARFDLGAKLYFIHSYVTQKNGTLAKELYNSHIAAFQDGIIEEHGNRTKKGYENYQATLIQLIEAFQTDSFDVNKSYIPVDQNMCLLDGAHRTACSIYFNKTVEIIMFPTIKAYTFDRNFFYKHALEQEYLDLMEYSLYAQGLDYNGKYDSQAHAREVLKINTMEENQAISISTKEKIRCKTIRFIRNRYTRLVIMIKKLLGMPV